MTQEKEKLEKNMAEEITMKRRTKMELFQEKKRNLYLATEIRKMRS